MYYHVYVLLMDTAICLMNWSTGTLITINISIHTHSYTRITHNVCVLMLPIALWIFLYIMPLRGPINYTTKRHSWYNILVAFFPYIYIIYYIYSCYYCLLLLLLLLLSVVLLLLPLLLQLHITTKCAISTFFSLPLSLSPVTLSTCAYLPSTIFSLSLSLISLPLVSLPLSISPSARKYRSD